MSTMRFATTGGMDRGVLPGREGHVAARRREAVACFVCGALSSGCAGIPWRSFRERFGDWYRLGAGTDAAKSGLFGRLLEFWRRLHVSVQRLPCSAGGAR